MFIPNMSIDSFTGKEKVSSVTQDQGLMFSFVNSQTVLKLLLLYSWEIIHESVHILTLGFQACKNGPRHLFVFIIVSLSLSL